MNRTRIWTALLLVCVSGWGGGAAAQESPVEKARRTLPPEVFETLTRMAEEAQAEGVPAEPLYIKALEGAAKRVPPDRLVPVLRSYADRLGMARRALGPEAPPSVVVAGADALQRGVDVDALRRLAGEGRHSPVAMLVLADLVESGVPTDRALEVVREAMMRRTADDRMLDIPARVRRLMREGHTARDAADRVRDAMRRRGGGHDIGPPVPPGAEPVTGDRAHDTRRRRGG